MFAWRRLLNKRLAGQEKAVAIAGRNAFGRRRRSKLEESQLPELERDCNAAMLSASRLAGEEPQSSCSPTTVGMTGQHCRPGVVFVGKESGMVMS